MDNPFDEMRRAVEIAKQTRRAIEMQSGTMADLIVGYLRSVPGYTLKKLKRELRDFNIHTGEWK